MNKIEMATVDGCIGVDFCEENTNEDKVKRTESHFATYLSNSLSLPILKQIASQPFKGSLDAIKVDECAGKKAIDNRLKKFKFYSKTQAQVNDGNNNGDDDASPIDVYDKSDQSSVEIDEIVAFGIDEVNQHVFMVEKMNEHENKMSVKSLKRLNDEMQIPSKTIAYVENSDNGRPSDSRDAQTIYVSSESHSPFASSMRGRSVRFSTHKSLHLDNSMDHLHVTIKSTDSSQTFNEKVDTSDVNFSMPHLSSVTVKADRGLRHTFSWSPSRSRPNARDDWRNKRCESVRYTPRNPYVLYPSLVTSRFAHLHDDRSEKDNRQTDWKRKSLLNKIFGDSGDRRFGPDLRPAGDLPSSSNPNVNDNNGQMPLDIESSDKRTSLPHCEEGGPSKNSDTPKSPSKLLPRPETSRVLMYQVFLPFLIAGFDNVGAGIILDGVQSWRVFKQIPELFILVASFLGLKGNLEMTLAARLATMANIGEIDKKSCRWQIALGNLTLVQGQAIIVAILASLIAISVNYLKGDTYDYNDWLVIASTALLTASITGLVMVTVMVIATVIARNIAINPDNVSALIASIMGDISAVTLLSYTARVLHSATSSIVYYAPMIIVFYFTLLPICLLIARKNTYTYDVVGTGWLPIILAMVISSGAGFILDLTVNLFHTIAMVQPVINGVAGNLIAVQASRISTYFHLRCPMGTLPSDEHDETYSFTCNSPASAFIGKHTNVKTARSLLLMCLPIHAIYFGAICMFKSHMMAVSLAYISCYFIVIVTQVSILLYSAHLLVPWLWRLRIDPDNAAIPILMAFSDLLGTILLTLAYFILQTMGDPFIERDTTAS